MLLTYIVGLIVLFFVAGVVSKLTNNFGDNEDMILAIGVCIVAWPVTLPLFSIFACLGIVALSIFSLGRYLTSLVIKRN